MEDTNIIADETIDTDSMDTLFTELFDPYLCVHITKRSPMDVDADMLVNYTNNVHSGRVGIDKIVMSSANEKLKREISKLPAMKSGAVAITSGGNLNFQFIAHTVLTNYYLSLFKISSKEIMNELERSVTNALDAAKQTECHSIVFPRALSGRNGYSTEDIAPIMHRKCTEWLRLNEDYQIDIYICTNGEQDYNAFNRIFEVDNI